MVKREFLSKRTSEAINDMNEVIKKIESLKKYKVLDERQTRRLNNVMNTVKRLSNEFPNMLETFFGSWLDKLKAEIIPIDPFCLETVINEYFCGEGAFRQPKSRDDFPDSFILCSVRDLLDSITEDDRLFVVVKDGFFRQCLERIKGIKVFTSFKDLFLLPQFEEAIQELDAESERVQTIKHFLQSDECKKILVSYLTSQSTELDGLYLSEEELSYDKIIFGLNVLSLNVELTDINEISNIFFGKVEYLGEEVYAIELEIRSLATAHYVANYGEYYALSDERKNRVEFKGMSDEVCELNEAVSCIFYGSIQFFIERMKVEEISIHMRYLQSGESPIGVSVEINKANIIEKA
jgi:hypothetical protein